MVSITPSSLYSPGVNSIQTPSRMLIVNGNHAKRFIHARLKARAWLCRVMLKRDALLVVDAEARVFKRAVNNDGVSRFVRGIPIAIMISFPERSPAQGQGNPGGEIHGWRLLPARALIRS